MIPFKVKRQRFFLPTSWGELPVGKILRLPELADDPIEFMQYITDCPHHFDSEVLLPFISWMAAPADLTIYEPAVGIPDIKTSSYGKRIECQSEIAANKPIESMVRAVAIYLDTDLKLHNKEDYSEFVDAWSLRTLDEICPVYINIIDQMEAILKMEKALSKPPTAEQIEAGIENFNQLGPMNTIDLLAGGNILNYDAVLLIDYNIVFAKLLKMKISDEFTENYRQIVQRNNRTK